MSPATGGAGPLDPLSAGAGALAGAGLNALESWVLDGAKAALQETAAVIRRTTTPRLQSTWFSATYWRVAGLAAVLTLPFLFAASVQALLRSDLALLARAAFAYLPLALIGVSLAAPIVMLLLSATDEMCAVVAAAGAGGGAHFLARTAVAISAAGLLDGSAFLGFAIGLFTLAAAIALAVEMLVREAAVYVVVLMLPLAFAGLVWPARRVWAVRLLELLIALILSKFVIVAVLSLAGAAFGSSGTPTITRVLTAMALLMLSTFSPWVMLRLLPFTELAAGAAGALRAELPRLAGMPTAALSAAEGPAAWAQSIPAMMGRHGDQTGSRRGMGRFSAEGGDPLASGQSRGDLAAEGGGPPEATASAPEAEDPLGDDGAVPDHSSEGTPAHGDEPLADETWSPGREADGPRGERLPGMSAIWQAGDGEWPPMVLGLDGGGGPAEYEPALPPSAHVAPSEPGLARPASSPEDDGDPPSSYTSSGSAGSRQTPDSPEVPLSQEGEEGLL